MEKLSIIVPVYNNAPWLPRCLDSLLAQTDCDLEIIVVDDGSTDDSYVVMQAYMARDSRVKAIHQENGGVTAARLRGVAEAAGDWIGFVDGDDEVEPQMFGRLLENAVSYGADISHCGYRLIFPDGSVDFHGRTNEMLVQDRFAGLQALLDGKLVEPGLCTKLYRRTLFSGLEQWMDRSVKNYEDLLMNFYLFRQAETSVYEGVCPYHYLLRQGSASGRNLTQARIYDPIRVRERILAESEPELVDTARNALLRGMLQVCAELAVSNGGEAAAHLKAVSRKLAEQKPYFGVLTRRNRLLANLIVVSPRLFRIAFRGYVAVSRKPEYT